MILVPKNWDAHQQYKDRKPQWIKLHRDLLNDFSYSSVRIGTKATLPLLWLLSCEYEDGIINATIEEISFRIHIDKSTVQSAINELCDIGMYESVQNCTEVYRSVPREEKRREENNYVVFEDIWKKYSAYIKTLGRTGGNKIKAKDGYVKLKKKYTDEDIVGLVGSFYKKDIGAKNLENILKDIEMRNYLIGVNNET